MNPWPNFSVEARCGIGPANFAEGFKKRGLADKIHFYNTAQGSLEECGYYLILARDLGYGDSRVLIRSLEELAS
jgi:four helix bundle protein